MPGLRRTRNAWRAARTLPSRTSLRVKLIAAVLSLVGVALVLISVAGVLVFRDYLIGQAAQQVRQQYDLAVLSMQNGRLHPGDISVGSIVIAWRLQGRQLPTTLYGTYPGAPRALLPDVPTSRSWVQAHPGQLVTVGGLHSSDRWLVITHSAKYYVAPFDTVQAGTLIVGVDLGDVSGSIARLATIDAIIAAVVLVGLAIVGVAVVRASLRPLSDIERTAQTIAAGDLSRRVRDQDPRTEVGRLGRSLNAMLAQIEAAFQARTASEEAARRSEDAARTSALIANRSEVRMRQFVADASHELRTPLTAIRGFAEHYRQRGGASGSELDRMFQRVEQEAKRMGVLVDDLLLLARLDQRRTMDFRTVDLLAIAADALHDARVIAPKRTINLTVQSPDAALVIGDEPSLRQVVGNLMSNAMTHTPDGTPIDITIRSDGHRPAPQPGGAEAAGTEPADTQPAGAQPPEPGIILEVTDRGPGLTADQREHVFERFYRTDRARSRTAGGTGLGLAIVAALVDAHHGRVWVESTPGEGATFGFALPLAPEARSPR